MSTSSHLKVSLFFGGRIKKYLSWRGIQNGGDYNYVNIVGGVLLLLSFLLLFLLIFPFDLCPMNSAPVLGYLVGHFQSTMRGIILIRHNGAGNHP